MIIVFDLDDTLYEETTYVKGGFTAVANYLFQTYHLDNPEKISNKLYEILLEKVEEKFLIFFYKTTIYQKLR